MIAVAAWFCRSTNKRGGETIALQDALRQTLKYDRTGLLRSFDNNHGTGKQILSKRKGKYPATSRRHTPPRYTSCGGRTKSQQARRHRTSCRVSQAALRSRKQPLTWLLFSCNTRTSHTLLLRPPPSPSFSSSPYMEQNDATKVQTLQHQ